MPTRLHEAGGSQTFSDGLILCAAPLEPLFADDGWRKRVSQHRRDLDKGKYPWATVQREFFGRGS
jgi:hypothetical protein